MRPKVKKQILVWLALAALLAVCPVFGAVQDEYILRCSPTAISGVLSRHGMTLVRSASEYSVYLVRSPAGAPPAQYLSEVSADLAVTAVEPNVDVVVPETPAGLQLNQSTASILDALANPTVIPFFRSMVLSSYVNQPAAVLIRVANTQKFFATGAGIVAVIDTGVDPDHPALAGSLVPGYDFTRDLAGPASEWLDLDQSTVVILDQASAPPVDVTLLPPAFGHGTMVSGLVHLVSPAAQIMPLKAFTADGTATVFDVERAIYYAVEHGAKVINMSFSMPTASDEFTQAIDEASGHGLISFASAGNSGRSALVYPAAFRNVMGIGSTTLTGERSSFTNYGDHLVKFAAPGEALITAFPGYHYASVSGTSFSTALATGGAALLSQLVPTIDQRMAGRYFDDGAVKPTGLDLGEGRIDLYETLRTHGNGNPPPPPAD